MESALYSASSGRYNSSHVENTQSEWSEADVIRKLQDETGITNERLAKESGLSTKAIARLVSGETKDPKRDTLTQLARVFGLSLDDLRSAVPKGPPIRFRVHESKLKQWRAERRKTQPGMERGIASPKRSRPAT